MQMSSERSRDIPAYDNSIPAVVECLRSGFVSGRTRSPAWRMEQLDALRQMLVENESKFIRALHDDLNKSKTETYTGELGFLAAEIRHAQKNLKRWIRPTRVAAPPACLPARCWIELHPLGVVLIIGAWNYPVQLLLGPLIGAIAAGNCAILKPSEHAPAAERILAELAPRYLDQRCFAVVRGGIAETAQLLSQRFDLIFYTGGAAAGKIVMAAAAQSLTPVVLELGGKCPAIVDRDVAVKTAARRIAWGRFINAGQTCVAPDYVLVHNDVENDLLAALAAAVREFFGQRPRESNDYGRIVSRRHVERLSKLLTATTACDPSRGEVVCGGEWDIEDRYFAPTILKNITPDAAVMGEEIFGPILPVLSVAGIDEAIEFAAARPDPLAVYLFTRNAAIRRRVPAETRSGGVCINDVVMQLTPPGLPFGGVGASGMGVYHGLHSFETFSHKKAVMRRTIWPDPKLRYPPYSEKKLKWLRRLM